MSFHTLLFPIAALPCILILWALAPKRWKDPVLVLLSLLLYAWGSPICAIILLISILFNFFVGKRIVLAEAKQRKRSLLLFGLAGNLLLLLAARYWPVLWSVFGGTADTAAGLLTYSVIGTGFFTLSALSYLFDLYRAQEALPASLTGCALYLSFFPKLFGGPVILYRDMAPQLQNHPIRAEKALAGGRRFLIGLAKKVLLSNQLSRVFFSVTSMHPGRISLVTAWIGALSYGLMLYYDLSGYADMAIGLGGIFGFTLPENFNYPLASKSLNEFWSRWHSTLGGWFREYVFEPLGGNHGRRSKTLRNLFLVWLLVGLWHGINWTFLVWAIYSAGLLALEALVLDHRLSRLPGWLRRGLTLLLVFLGWSFFFSPDVGTALTYFHRMIGIFTVPFADDGATYYLRSSWLILLIALIGGLPVVRGLCQSVMQSKHLVLQGVAVIVFGVLLWFCIAAMVSAPNAILFYPQF